MSGERSEMSLRGTFGLDKSRNALHGSRSWQAAQEECRLLFPDGQSVPELRSRKFELCKSEGATLCEVACVVLPAPSLATGDAASLLDK